MSHDEREGSDVSDHCDARSHCSDHNGKDQEFPLVRWPLQDSKRQKQQTVNYWCPYDSVIEIQSRNDDPSDRSSQQSSNTIAPEDAAVSSGTQRSLWSLGQCENDRKNEKWIGFNLTSSGRNEATYDNKIPSMTIRNTNRETIALCSMTGSTTVCMLANLGRNVIAVNHGCHEHHIHDVTRLLHLIKGCVLLKQRIIVAKFDETPCYILSLFIATFSACLRPHPMCCFFCGRWNIKHTAVSFALAGQMYPCA